MLVWLYSAPLGVGLIQSTESNNLTSVVMADTVFSTKNVATSLVLKGPLNDTYADSHNRVLRAGRREESPTAREDDAYLWTLWSHGPSWGRGYR